MKLKIIILNDTALSVASAAGHTDIVKLLLEQPKIDVNHKNILIQKF